VGRGYTLILFTVEINSVVSYSICHFHPSLIFVCKVGAYLNRVITGLLSKSRIQLLIQILDLDKVSYSDQHSSLQCHGTNNLFIQGSLTEGEVSVQLTSSY